MIRARVVVAAALVGLVVAGLALTASASYLHSRYGLPTRTISSEFGIPPGWYAEAAAAAEAQAAESGVHGGSVERTHEGCQLPEGADALNGNWTHGDYVSAWSASGDAVAHQTAAHSACGKPTHARGPSSMSHGQSGMAHGQSEQGSSEDESGS
jgi:hypothetical protein